MITAMSHYLEEIGVEHSTDWDASSVTFEVETSIGDAPCFFIIDEGQGVALYSCLPMPIPNHKLTEIALYITCLNHNRLFGCFELNLKTGNLFFRTYIDLTQQPISATIIEKHMSINLSVMQEYMLDIIARVS